jgi:hypothetical protein
VTFPSLLLAKHAVRLCRIDVTCSALKVAIIKRRAGL